MWIYFRELENKIFGGFTKKTLKSKKIHSKIKLPKINFFKVENNNNLSNYV